MTYKILVTQHDLSDDVIGVDFWEVRSMPDPQQLGEEVFIRFGDCYQAIASVSVDEIALPLYVVIIEGRNGGKQN